MNWVDAFDASNFGGTFSFASLTEFADRRPIQFTVRRGNPEATASEVDAGVFTEVDMRPARFGRNRGRSALRLAIAARRLEQRRAARVDRVRPLGAVVRRSRRCRRVLSVAFRGGRRAIAAVRGRWSSGNHDWPRRPFRCPPRPPPFQDARLSVWQLDPNLRAPMTTQATVGSGAFAVATDNARPRVPAHADVGRFRARDVNAPADRYRPRVRTRRD